jgi:hypothetical protein
MTGHPNTYKAPAVQVKRSSRAVVFERGDEDVRSLSTVCLRFEVGEEIGLRTQH